MISNKIHLLAKKIWHATYIRFRDFTVERKYKRYWGEHRSRGGTKYKDKIFYIVRRRELYTGLFSNFMIYVYKTKAALDAGYIPVIDMQKSKNIYLNKDQVGKVNAWEYYFKQPSGYSLNDVAKAKNIIWGSGYSDECFPYRDVNYLLNVDGDFGKYRYVAKKYFKLSDEAQKRVDDFYSSELQGGGGESVGGIVPGNRLYGYKTFWTSCSTESGKCVS